MMTCKILGVEPCQSKNGKQYWKLNTDQGKIQVFDQAVALNLSTFIGKTIEFEPIISGANSEYTSLKAFKVSDVQPNASQTVTNAPQSPISGKDREMSMRAGVAYRYAVDLCIGGKIDLAQIDEFAKHLFDAMEGLSNE
jgi:hypothetical protein